MKVNTNASGKRISRDTFVLARAISRFLPLPFVAYHSTYPVRSPLISSSPTTYLAILYRSREHPLRSTSFSLIFERLSNNTNACCKQYDFF